MTEPSTDLQRLLDERGVSIHVCRGNFSDPSVSDAVRRLVVEIIASEGSAGIRQLDSGGEQEGRSAPLS